MNFQDKEIFNELFVLELANNHWGSLERGKKIVDAYAQVVRENGVRATVKLQFRDVESFIHKDFLNSNEIRYIWKTRETAMPWDQMLELVQHIKKSGMITMATPFDEVSVKKCVEFEIDIIKVASSDISDWPLLEAIAATGKPVSISIGGAETKDLENIANFFNRRKVPLAINNCVSQYPTEDEDLKLNQIDYLVQKYPDNVIGLSSHEYHDWHTSVTIAYAKGARTFERHVDITDPIKAGEEYKVSSYCSLPHQVDEWFKAFKKAKEMCGNGQYTSLRNIPKKETVYLNELVRGIYARRPLKAGEVITKENFNELFYMAVPLLKGQISCREVLTGIALTHDVAQDYPVAIHDINSTYASDNLKSLIYDRGFDHKYFDYVNKK